MSRMISLPKASADRLEEIRGILGANSPTPVGRSAAAAYAVDWALLLCLQELAKGYAPRPQGETGRIIDRHRRVIEERRQAQEQEQAAASNAG